MSSVLLCAMSQTDEVYHQNLNSAVNMECFETIKVLHKICEMTERLRHNVPGGNCQHSRICEFD